MQILPNGLCQFIDSSGAPLASGTVGFYAPGTLNPLTTFQDQAGTIPNANPVPLNSRGQALIWGSGIYRQILKDASGVTIWDALTQSADAAFSGSTGASLIGFDGTNLAVQLQTRINRVVDSIASLRALSKATYTRAFVTGYYAPRDGGGGAYSYDASDTTTADNGCTVIVATDGGRWKIQQTGYISVLQAGAKGDNVTNDTNAFRAAAATGLNVYVPATTAGYQILDAVTFATISQKVFGDGRFKTVINVPATFNMAATGVFVSGATCVEYIDLSILFVQPDTSTIASMTQYPAAISGRGQPGQRVIRCRISRAWVGLDWLDNVGQSTVDDLICSAFFAAINLDGAVDSVRIDNLHCWPVDLTTNQTTAMTLNGSIGINSGRCDDLKVNGGLMFVDTPFNFFTGTRANAGTTIGTITDTDQDGFGGIAMNGGTIAVVGGLLTAGTLNHPKLNIFSGSISYTGCQMLVNAAFPAAAGQAFMSVRGASATLTMTGCSISHTVDACIVSCPSGTMSIVGNTIVHQANAVFAQPFFITDAQGIANITDNTTGPLGTGSAVFYSALADGPNVVTGNLLFGHQIVAPEGTGYYEENFDNVATAQFVGARLKGKVKTRRFTGALVGGVVTFAHGISNLNQKLILSSGYFRGGSGEAQPLPITVDGGNINATGGAGTAAYRITVQYTDQQQGW